jgi:hypothetical protein
MPLSPDVLRARSNPSLHPTAASWLRHLSSAGELQLQGLPFLASGFDLSVSFVSVTLCVGVEAEADCGTTNGHWCSDQLAAGPDEQDARGGLIR